MTRLPLVVLALTLVPSAGSAAAPPDYRLPVRLEAVAKGEKAGGLSAEARAALQRDGSVAVGGRQHFFFSLYDENAYRGIPSFVTLDALLHVFHVRFDDALRRFEVEQMEPQLRDFASRQAARALGYFPKQGPVDPRIERLAAYHGVPLALLLGPRWREALPAGIEPAALEWFARRVEEAADKVRAASGFGKGDLCPRPLDFTRF